MRTVTYTIFLSRPSDVESHVETVKQAVADINLVSAPLGARFDLFDWRENATPGLDVEPQARVNIQSENHDAFIALVGATLGTPTINYESGTVEEIERAISKAEDSVFGGNSVSILFKDVSLNINSDLDQAKKVQALRSSLGPRGILYRTFGNDDDLRDVVFRCLGVLLSGHVSMQAENLPAPKVVSKVDVTSSNVGVNHSAVDDAEELGILDYSQIISDRIESATNASLSISEAMKVLTSATSKATDEISIATNMEDQSAKKKIINDVADAINICADNFERSGDQVHVEFRRALDAIRELIDIQMSDMSGEHFDSEIAIVYEMTKSLDPTITETMSQTKNFGEMIAGLPRLTKELNSSKRRLQRSIESLVAGLAVVRSENNALNEYAASRISAGTSEKVALGN